MATIGSPNNLSFGFEAGGTSSELRVIRFHGQEAISDLFHFEIDLVSTDSDIDFDAVLQGDAVFSIRSGDDVRKFSGVLREFEQFDMGPTYTNYRAVLVPRLWLLAITHQSRIFQDQTIPKIVSDVLKEHGLTIKDYDLTLKGEYPSREYVVQYQETDLNFISRWLEHEGIFYFHKDEKLIFGDDPTIHAPFSKDPKLPYHPPTSLEPLGSESVHSLVSRQRMLPDKVTLKDYNWRKTGLDLKVGGKAAKGGKGTFMEYGNHYKDTGEGSRLAKVRGEEFDCRKRLMVGTSDCRSFRPGFKYELESHYREDLNQEYLLVEVSHFGSQTGAAAEGGDDQQERASATYSNEFLSVPADVSFRPERQTPKPKLYGTINAKVDGTGSGQYADIDKEGRYKVTLPFDLSGKSGGKASRFIRMAQPYAGSNYGMHFPLHKGIEVILSCIDGDPDRPIICGSVPNPETSSPVTSVNQTQSIIRDYAGNEIVMEGVESGTQMRLHSPTHNTTITLGSSISQYTESDQKIRVSGERREEIGRDRHLRVNGDQNEKCDGTISREAGMDLQEKTGMKYAMEAGMEIHLKSGMNLVLESGTTLTLKVGGSFINLNPAGVFISGAMVMINSGGAAGAGSGSSPEPPKAPGVTSTATPRAKPVVYSPAALALKNGAVSGAPFCRICSKK